MPTLKKKINFFESEEGAAVRQSLQSMVSDKAYNTGSTYSANGELYPDNLISFVEKHMIYLNTHPAIDPRHYIANLRLMTKLR